jgi:hypothetical protein
LRSGVGHAMEYYQEVSVGLTHGECIKMLGRLQLEKSAKRGDKSLQDIARSV